MSIFLGQLVLYDWANNWLTPVWLLCIGALISVVVLLAVWGLAFIVGQLPGLQRIKRGASEAPQIVAEGPLWPLLSLVGVMAFTAILGWFTMRDRADILDSFVRVPLMGERLYRDEVPPTPRDELGEADDAQESTFSVSFRRRELKQIQIQASENIFVYTTPFEEGVRRTSFDVAAGIPFEWVRNSRNLVNFPDQQIDQLFIVNRGAQPADVSFLVSTRPANPEVIHSLIAAACVVVVVLLYFAQALFAPRMSAVALATFKSEIAQPMFMILLALGMVLLAIFVILPGHTMGEDIKMLKDNGLTLIMIAGMIQAVWAAGTSVSEEVEGRTALTVLSKPITRRSFIGGKYVGILWTVLLLFVLLGLWFLVLVAYKPIYDAKESSEQLDTAAKQVGVEAPWQVCHKEMADTIPGLTLSFMETAVMASLAVAISTRLPLLANMVICLAIYVLGHLTPVLVESTSASGQFEVVIFVAQLIATIFPNLESFNVSPSVAAGVAVPWAYLGWALIYSLVYSVIAMFLALFMFEDRDLA